MSPLATVRVDQFSSQPTLVMAAALLLAVTLIYLAGLPGRVARRRARVRWRAIAAIGWLSLIVWPLWPVAMLLARRRPRRGPSQRSARDAFRVRVTCDDVPAHRRRRQTAQRVRDQAEGA
jgi:hypothetical protein